ncbi:suppressor of loss of ypt1 [Tulasnella sp. 419]|nr:suppressor of loss of ypt1 [Tulasnella sp. 419]
MISEKLAPVGHEERQWRAPVGPTSQTWNGGAPKVNGWANGGVQDSQHWEKSDGLLPNPATMEKRSTISSLVHSLASSFYSSKQRPSLTDSGTSSISYATIRFVLLCALWYTTSALSSNTGKSIMNQFRYPITLTFVQFGFVSGYCLLFANPWFGATRMRYPTKAILRSTFPMAVFQVGGHLFSSMAISRVPVSTVHTIKALSPLFTVAAYALLFGVRYSAKTYMSLLPLTIGVMLACSFDMSADNALGLICAFGSAIVFVSSNIFFKKVMPSHGTGSSGQASVTPNHKLDKLNLLFYSSGLAFLLMIPVWLWSDFSRLWDHDHHAALKSAKAPAHGVLYYFFLNGTVHWAQNIIAFAILSITSPVTYSIASLVKRIAVICIAIVWFNQAVHGIQALGICLTFFGLWMYNNAKADVEKGENKMRRVEARKEFALPTTKADSKMLELTPASSPQPDESEWASSAAVSPVGELGYTGYGNPPIRPVMHKHRSSLSQATLVPYPQGAPKLTAPRSTGGYGAHLPQTQQTRIPPPLDTKSLLHEGGKPLHRMSPTESYPSPPASAESSPPLTSLPSFALQPPSGGLDTGLYNRRPIAYESSSSIGDPLSSTPRIQVPAITATS